MGQCGDSRAETPEMLTSVNGGDTGISWDLAEEENGPSTHELQQMKTLQFVLRALFLTLEF